MTTLEKTLAQMETIFSSNQFAKKAMRNGFSQHEIDRGYMRAFLESNATKHGSKRMWIKKGTPQIKFDPIQDAIELLKSNGYKVMKPISEWVEL